MTHRIEVILNPCGVPGLSAEPHSLRLAGFDLNYFAYHFVIQRVDLIIIND